jgi:hypothetical protein
MATTDPKHDTTQPPDSGRPLESSTGQSVERERQEEAITRASRESWLSQLLRGFRSSKGRPKPGDPKSSGTGPP